jgi:hypothetical protein
MAASEPTDQPLGCRVTFWRGTGRKQPEAHHVEIDQGAHRLAELVDKVADLEAGAEDGRQRRDGLQALATATLAMQDDHGLHEGADEVGDLPARGRMGLAVDSGGRAHDDDRPGAAPARVERHGEPGPESRLDDLRQELVLLEPAAIAMSATTCSLEHVRQPELRRRHAITAAERRGVVAAVAKDGAAYRVRGEDRARFTRRPPDAR